jgi:hypothetical protein
VCVRLVAAVLSSLLRRIRWLLSLVNVCIVLRVVGRLLRRWLRRTLVLRISSWLGLRLVVCLGALVARCGGAGLRFHDGGSGSDS